MRKLRAAWPPPSDAGTAGFGPAAAVLLGLALASGLVIAAVAPRRRPPGLIVVFHAGGAIAGFALLWTLVRLS